MRRSITVPMVLWKKKQAKKNIKRGIPVGVNLRIKNKKSRSFVPKLGTEGIQLYFDCGINPVSGLLSSLINAGRVEMKGGGVYTISPAYTDGKAVNFKAKKDLNLVPLDVLLEYPKLVDAESKEELEGYLKFFDASVNYSTDGIVEKETGEKDDIDDDDEADQKMEEILSADEESED